MEGFVHMPEGAGWIEAIVGPMFSGKSEEMIRRVTRAFYAKRKVQIFKPKRDTRSGVDKVVSRNGQRVEATGVAHIYEVLDLLDEDTRIVAIDEGQFFYERNAPDSHHELRRLCEVVADRGLRVIVSGLDLDFRGLPFPPIALLLGAAEHVTKLGALCTVCGTPAYRSVLLATPEGDFTIGSDQYEARCRRHSVTEQRRKVNRLIIKSL